jgi:hypothetical protein
MGRPSCAASAEIAEPFGVGRTRLVSAGMAVSEAGDSEYGVSAETRWRSTASVALTFWAKVAAESSR